MSLINFQTLFTLHLDETYLICVPKNDYNHLFVVSTFLLFVIPMSIITILYVLIGLQLRKSKIVQRGAVNGSSVRLKVNFLRLPHSGICRESNLRCPKHQKYQTAYHNNFSQNKQNSHFYFETWHPSEKWVIRITLRNQLPTFTRFTPRIILLCNKKSLRKQRDFDSLSSPSNQKLHVATKRFGIIFNISVTFNFEDNPRVVGTNMNLCLKIWV